MRAARKLIIAAGIVVLLIVGGTWFYINVIKDDPAEKLTLETKTTAEVATLTGSVEGNWTIGDGSKVGYRVQEILFGQSATAVGRTSDVTGGMTIAGTVVTTAEFTADMTTVTSNEDRRDNQFKGRIMEVDQFPTATFTLTKPIDLVTVPTDTAVHKYSATGNLTMHGQTKSVTFTISARRTGEKIQINGLIPITFADYGIDNPSFGPAEVGDDGELEFLLTMVKS